jgi:uncharacterized iron-regulated protein
MRKLFVLFIVFFTFTAFKSDKPAYRLFNAKGKAVKYKKVLAAAAKADVVFFGEEHNDPICHWLELEITKDLYNIKDGKIILGAEMFERDNQLILDEYLKGEVSKANFNQEARLWPNYKTDYQPLVTFARDHQLKFIATNIPRRYASMVYRKGFGILDSLTAEAKSYMPPLPIPYDPDLKGYKDMLQQMGGMMGHASPNLPKAQAIKDATMAWYIAKNAGNGDLFIHYNGAYHSDNFQGIIWYLNQYKPGLKIMTISSVEQKDVDSLSKANLNKANFILAVPQDMTKTY